MFLLCFFFLTSQFLKSYKHSIHSYSYITITISILSKWKTISYKMEWTNWMKSRKIIFPKTLDHKCCRWIFFLNMINDKINIVWEYQSKKMTTELYNIFDTDMKGLNMFITTAYNDMLIIFKHMWGRVKIWTNFWGD